MIRYSDHLNNIGFRLWTSWGKPAGSGGGLVLNMTLAFKRAERLLLVKYNDKKWFMPPYSWVILPLAQPQVANQQQKNLSAIQITIQIIQVSVIWSVLFSNDIWKPNSWHTKRIWNLYYHVWYSDLHCITYPWLHPFLTTKIQFAHYPKTLCTPYADCHTWQQKPTKHRRITLPVIAICQKLADSKITCVSL